MGEFDGMWNQTKGGWNPSRDDFRYDQSNSMTGMDFALGGMGIRKFGIGSKPPFWARIGNKHAELTYKGAKGIYRGQSKVRAWKRNLESKITKKLAPDRRATPYGQTRRQSLTEKGKRVLRILNSKKGRAGTSAATLWGIGQIGEQMNNSNGDSWVIRKNKKKRRIGFS